MQIGLKHPKSLILTVPLTSASNSQPVRQYFLIIIPEGFCSLLLLILFLDLRCQLRVESLLQVLKVMVIELGRVIRVLGVILLFSFVFDALSYR